MDDPNSMELEEMISKDRPDLILAGIKEKYMAHKLGVPTIMIHSYENGPYIGFEGFVNLAKDMYSYIYNPIWNMLEFEENPAEEVASEEITESVETADEAEVGK